MWTSTPGIKTCALASKPSNFVLCAPVGLWAAKLKSTMKKITFGQRFRYWFDNLMSKGSVAMIGLLAVASLVMVATGAAVLTLFSIYPEGGTPLHFAEGAWVSLARTMDSGAVGGDVGWPYRVVGLLVTIGGIFIFSSLIGVLSNGINAKLEDLRKGRSFVIEQDHTLILGWSSKIFTIVSELAIANQNKKNARIVILADREKVEMEDEIRDKVEQLFSSKVICRKGSPNDMTDLRIANCNASKSIIILAAEEGNPDPMTIKTILAITNDPQRRQAPYHIIAEVKDRRNLEVARMIAKDEVELLMTDDIIGKIMVQTSRQSGVSIVYTELMNFDGGEVYFNEEKSLVGKKYGEILAAYADSAVMGLQFVDGSVKINPPMDHVVKAGERVIALTNDDDTLVVSATGGNAVNEAAILNLNSARVVPERILMLGWNRRAFVVIKEIDNYVAPGSYMRIVSAYDTDLERILEMKANLRNITLEFQQADTTAREVIDALDIVSYDSVQLLCYKEEMEIQDADAQTLIALLHLRRVLEQSGKDIKIVSEMLDLRNRDLAEVTKADDFIVSDKLISLLMAQVSENKHTMRVFDDLFNALGSEIYVNPIADYVKTGTPVDFYTVLESARRKGQTAIGYRVTAQAFDSSHDYGIVLNPKKSAAVSFGELDRVIVLAES